MPARVLLADDQKVMRMLVENILAASDAYTLVASLENTRGADVLCREQNIDLALLDIVFADGGSGLDAARAIKTASPRTKVVMMTSMPEVSYLDRAREIGVDSFWYKEVQDLPLLTLLDRTMAGERIYPDATPELMLGNAPGTEFTPRELEVLRMMTTGATNAEIGEALHMSEHTVKRHISDMLEKTGYANRTILAVQARVLGFVIEG